MSPATAVLITLGISILSFLGSTVFWLVKFGEYKNKVDALPDKVDQANQSVKSLHERFDGFWKAMASYENRLGQTEGELRRVNGKGGH